MDEKTLHNEILRCVLPEVFRKRFAEMGHVFTQKELLALAYHYAPNFDERLRLLQLLAAHATEVSAHAKKIIAWQNNCLDCFKNHAEDEVYELHIKETPDACDERYLCGSFETALETIDGFYTEYCNGTENPLAAYEIVKRKILRASEPFREDWLGACDLSAGKTLVSFYHGFDNDNEFGTCASDCDECPQPCVSSMQVEFPALIADRAAVRFGANGNFTKYGIHLNFDQAEKLSDYYILPLDGYTMESGKYDDDMWDHEHIRCFDAEEISSEELPPVFRARYESFLLWLTEHYTEDYRWKNPSC